MLSSVSLIVGKLDRLARSLPDAWDIAEKLAAKGVSLGLGGSACDPLEVVGRLLCYPQYIGGPRAVRDRAGE